MIPLNDLAFYWVAACQFVTGHNPYLPGMAGQKLVMFGPPWTLAVTFWIGWLPLQVVGFLWMVLSVNLVAVSVLWLWELYGQGRSKRWAVLLTASFMAVIIAIVMGQITPLLLFGVAGFLRYEPRRPWLAGALLTLVTLKPHIAFVVWPALVLCAFFLKRWKPLAGFMATFLGANLFVVAVRPTVFWEWWTMTQAHHLAYFDTDTIASVLRHLFHYAPMQYFPAAVALAWFAWRWKTAESGWEWKVEMPLLLLVSMVATPYSWYSDEIILLPAVFYGAARVWETTWRGPLAAAFFAVNLPIPILGFAFRQEFWFTWYALIWLILYVLAALPHGHRLTGRDPVGSVAAE